MGTYNFILLFCEIIIHLTDIAEGQEQTICLQNETKYNHLSIQCNSSGEILHIYHVLEGRTPNANDTICNYYDKKDCVQQSFHHTERFRAGCDMKHSCSQTITRRPLEQCDVSHRGRNFATAIYVCLSKHSRTNNVETIPIVNPFSAKLRRVEGKQLFLQTSSYPMLWDRFINTTCEVHLSLDTVFVRVDIYDLSYNYRLSNVTSSSAPYSLTLGNETSSYAKNFSIFSTLEMVPVKDSRIAYLGLTSQDRTKDMGARFWIHLSAIGKNKQWATKNLTMICRPEILQTQNVSTNDTGSPNHVTEKFQEESIHLKDSILGFMIGGSIACLVTIVCLISILAIVCARRKAKRHLHLYSDDNALSRDDNSSEGSDNSSKSTRFPCMRSSTLDHQVDDVQPYAVCGPQEKFSYAVANSCNGIPEGIIRKPIRDGICKKGTSRNSSSSTASRPFSYVSIPERGHSFLSTNPVYAEISDVLDYGLLANVQTGAHGDQKTPSETIPTRQALSVMYAKPNKMSAQPLDEELVIIENDLYGT